MRRDIVAALDQRAASLSTGLAYPPAKASTTDEILTLVKEVAAADALWTTHMLRKGPGAMPRAGSCPACPSPDPRTLRPRPVRRTAPAGT